MGLPLSRFQMMSGLFSGDYFYARKLSQFKMVCIVLPDPYDNTFRRRMKDSFLALHEQTGQDMLFISFVNPPKEWRDTRRSLDFESVEKQNLFAEEGSDDKQLISSFIRSTAPNTQLPAIIVTDDLISDRYVILESSISRFEEQLVEIGLFCTNSDGRTQVIDGRFLEVLDKLGRYQIIRDETRPLAARLADVFAIQPRNYERFSKSWADARLTALEQEMKNGGQDAAVAYYNYQTSIQKAKDTIRRINTPKPPASDQHSIRPPKGGDEFRLLITDEMAEITPEYAPTFYKQYKIEEHGVKGLRLCEPLSKDNIEQFNNQLQFLQFTIHKRHPSEDDMMYMDSEHSRVRSFMPLACFLNDFMDREINLSLVQQMRQLYGIEMPEYFARFKPGCWAKVQTPRQEVKLNAVTSPDKWVPVMFGQAMYAYLEVCNPFSSPHIDEPLGDEFMSLWKILLDCRNITDHAQYNPESIMNYPLFKEQYGAFSRILEKYLWKMMDIKNKLRG